MEPSIAHSVFLSQEFDPFCDGYVETVTRMNARELMTLPQLNDSEYLDQLARGFDSIPTRKIRAVSDNLFDPNVDEQMNYRPDIEIEWQDLMIGGPASINYMSALMVVASKKDFSLKADFNYTFVKYPNSFHATLVQVANDMSNALYGAHTGMDKLQANMRQIPTLLKTALKLITQASTAMIKTMLPGTLANIGRYANENAAVAQASLERFERLQLLLQEVVLVSTLTNKDNRDTAEKLANETRKLREEKETMNIAIASWATEYETARKDLEMARAAYHAAMTNVPGSQWDTAAWNVYVSTRPPFLCIRWWFWRLCRYYCDEYFVEYSQAARQKAQDALDLLKKAEQHSKDLFNKHMEKQDALGVAISTLATINFSELSINQTIKVLLDAAQKISMLQEQWTRITRFFSKIALQSERAQQVVLENFLGVISNMESMGKSLDLKDKALYTVLLVETATDIDRDSHLLFLMAKTYSDVSHEYMVNQIASVAGFLTIQTDAEREACLRDLGVRSKVTSDKVKELATERQRTYELASISRQDQYTQFIEEATFHEGLNSPNVIGIAGR